MEKVFRSKDVFGSKKLVLTNFEKEKFQSKKISSKKNWIKNFELEKILGH